MVCGRRRIASRLANEICEGGLPIDGDKNNIVRERLDYGDEKRTANL